MKLTVHDKTVYVAAGSAEVEADAAAVVFVHGAGFDHTMWVMPKRHFSRRGYRVLAVDLPAHGRSQGPALTTVEAMADWLAAVLDAAHIADAAVVGHSMGALVGYAFAVRYPERCRTLTLLGAAVPMAVTPLLLDAAADDDHAAIDMANTWSHSARARLGGNVNPGVWMLGSGQRLIERAGPGVYHADFVACNEYRPSERAPQAPTLIIVGDADQMTPAAAGVALAARLPGARVVHLPGCGHSMLSEAPNDVLDAIISNV